MWFEARLTPKCTAQATRWWHLMLGPRASNSCWWQASPLASPSCNMVSGYLVCSSTIRMRSTHWVHLQEQCSWELKGPMIELSQLTCATSFFGLQVRSS